MVYHIRKNEDQWWTVGTMDNDVFTPISDHPSNEEAMARIRYLNGGTVHEFQQTRQHSLRAGMMHADDAKSLPSGRVVIHADDHFVHLVTYDIRHEVVVSGLHVRTVGVDTLPGFTQWCDVDTAAAISAWLVEQELWIPDDWIAWIDLKRNGPTYRNRRFGR